MRLESIFHERVIFRHVCTGGADWRDLVLWGGGQ